MAGQDDLWRALLATGEQLATEEDYEHGYEREVRRDLIQYVGFRVANEFYAVGIDEISEIAKPLDTTPVPRTADFVVGIGSVRGVVIPVIDMPTRLGLRKLPATRDNRVLIVEQGGERYGLAVDAVEGVVTVVPEELEDAPGAIFGAKGEFILALARHNARLYIILDLAMLLKGEHFLAPHIRGGGARGW